MKNKPIKIVTFFLFIVFVAMFLSAKCSAEKLDKTISDDPRILFLSSYNYDWESVPLQLQGVADTISGYANVDYVFMDTKQREYKEVKSGIYAQIKSYESKNGTYDYILAGDDAALHFVLEYREELFANVPVVFEGINDEKFAFEAAEDPLITGIVERFPLKETIQLALKINKNAKKVVAITDDTLSGKGSAKQFLKCKGQFSNLNFDMLDTSVLSADEIAGRVKSYGKDTILIFLLMTNEENRCGFSNAEATEFISANANIPVYKADELGIGNGILGGEVVSYREMAAKAAKIILEVSRGTPFSSFGLETAPVRYKFDKKIMNRFSIKKNQLPKNTVYINERQGFLKRNREMIVPFLLMCTLAVTILVVAVLGRKRHLKMLQIEKMAEEVLINQTERLKTIFNHIAVGVYVCEMRQNHYTVLFANNAYCTILGHDHDTIVGKTDDRALVFVHPDDVPILKNAARVMMEPDQSVVYEYRAKNADTNQYIWLLATGRSIMENGKLLVYTSVVDITERKKTQELELALETEKKANQAKTQFLSNMSHEIRTPMNAIIGMTKLAEDEKIENPALKNYLSEIDEASTYLLGIINDILDMNKIESGKMTLEKGWISPEEIIKPCVNIITPQMKKKNISFICPGYPKMEYEYYVDEQKVKQMIMNLLNNAYKFTQIGGRVKISAKNVSFDESTHTAVDAISVEDNGFGMSKEFLDRVFIPFEQARMEKAGAVQGTGLGLPLTKHIANLMGGDVTVESELGKGSRFTITFPYKYRKLDAQKNETKSEYARQNQEIQLQGKKILMAEDHPVNATIVIKLLEKMSVTVVRAKDGVEAVSLFAQSAPGEYDAVLMDIRMPNMDGLEATRKIRLLDRQDAKTIPIIALTANAFDQDRDETAEAGMSAHLSKPVNPVELYQTLSDCIINQ